METRAVVREQTTRAPQTLARAGGHGSAIIVGASSGIGAALARRLAAQGYRVALVARRGEVLDQLAHEIAAATPPPDGAEVAPQAPLTYAHDVTEYDAAPALFARIVGDLGGVPDLFVFAAGVLPRGEQRTEGRAWSFAEEQQALTINAVGAVRWLGLAADAFSAARRGVIVGISSVAGDRGRPGNGAYMASKAALSTYLDSLRYRLKASGVRVVTIKPGYVATPMIAGIATPRPLTISADAAAERIVRASASANGVVYVPGVWAPIMWVVRHLPSALMARLPA